MRRVLRNIAGWTGAITFTFSSVILLATYFTYTEKVIVPILLVIILISLIILIFTDEE